MKLFKHRFPLANEDGQTRQRREGEFIVLGNEAEIGEDNWAVIPYGDWKHADGLQRFDESAALKIMGKFKSIAQRIKRAIVGLPIFKGHPDLAGQYAEDLPRISDPVQRADLQRRIDQLANDYPDHTEYGQIADMEVRPAGLALKLVLSNAGAELVKAGKRFISPNWDAKVIGWVNRQMPIWSPGMMNSVGLTSTPNIPVRSLVNSAAAAAASTQTKDMIPTKLLQELGLPENATEEQATAAITALKARPESATLANETAAKTAAEGKVTALEGEKSTLTTKVTEAQTALANERKERIGGLVADAIRTGRILEAEKETWTRRLGENFAAESTALANAVPKVKTASEIPAMLATLQAQMEKDLANAGGNAGGDGMSDEDKGAKIKKFCNAEMAKLGHITNTHSRFNAAFANVKRAHPELFGAVEPKA